MSKPVPNKQVVQFTSGVRLEYGLRCGRDEWCSDGCGNDSYSDVRLYTPRADERWLHSPRWLDPIVTGVTRTLGALGYREVDAGAGEGTR